MAKKTEKVGKTKDGDKKEFNENGAGIEGTKGAGSTEEGEKKDGENSILGGSIAKVKEALPPLSVKELDVLLEAEKAGENRKGAIEVIKAAIEAKKPLSDAPPGKQKESIEEMKKRLVALEAEDKLRCTEEDASLHMDGIIMTNQKHRKAAIESLKGRIEAA